MIKKYLRKILIKYLTISNTKKLIKSAIKLYNNNNKIEGDDGLIIFPCDPESVTGSRGDEAMIQASITNFRQRHPNSTIYIVGQGQLASHFVDRSQLDSNLKFISTTNFSNLEELIKITSQIKPKEAVVIGADCIDGAYSPVLSITLIALFNILNKYGLKTRMTGFSFNACPHKAVIRAVKKIGGNETYNVRDKYSHTRFKNITGAKCSLIADAAFLLGPQTDFNGFSKIKEWIDKKKAQHRTIIAFNLHPMLRKYNNPDEIKDDAVKVAENIKILLAENPLVDLIFVPHDDRDRINDGVMLTAIYEMLLSSSYSERLFYDPIVPQAKNIKAVVALTDGLISSRMHLAIAALGSGVPVLGTDYQDKFPGLFVHFQLPNEFLLSANDFFSDKFIVVSKVFFKQLPELKRIIEQNIQEIHKLAQLNFE